MADIGKIADSLHVQSISKDEFYVYEILTTSKYPIPVNWNFASDTLNILNDLVDRGFVHSSYAEGQQTVSIKDPDIENLMEEAVRNYKYSRSRNAEMPWVDAMSKMSGE